MSVSENVVILKVAAKLFLVYEWLVGCSYGCYDGCQVNKINLTDTFPKNIIANDDSNFVGCNEISYCS